MDTILLFLLVILIAFVAILAVELFAKKEHFIVNPNPPSDTAISTEIKNMSLPKLLVSNIKTITATQLPLSQYAIKGAYNAASSGTIVSKDAIKYVIGRGCRFLDFEVYIDNTNPIVAFSNVIITPNTDTTSIKLDSANSLLLDDVFTTITSTAFNSTGSPNFGDPLFIHLRLKSGGADLTPIANSIKKNLEGKLYLGNTVNAQTPLSSIMGKIIIAVHSGASNFTQIKNYINIITRSTQWRTHTYRNIDNMAVNPPIINIIGTDGTTTTNTTELKLATPAMYSDTIIPPPFSIFSQYGIQTLLVPFYAANKENIIQYEQLFNTCDAGIVPFSIMVSYSTDLENKTAKKPKLRLPPLPKPVKA
jgi:hypothetical protein